MFVLCLLNSFVGDLNPFDQVWDTVLVGAAALLNTLWGPEHNMVGNGGERMGGGKGGWKTCCCCQQQLLLCHSYRPMVMMTKAGVITTCKETIRTAYCGGAGPPCGKGRGAKSNAMWREEKKKVLGKTWGGRLKNPNGPLNGSYK